MAEPIVACATPWGWGAISVLRVSGDDLTRILVEVCEIKRLPRPRRASLVRFRGSHGFIDEGLLTWMPGPASYTGEDLAELSCHGNPLIVEQLLGALVEAGARPALAGEFTRRAFLNGRLDLTRAEAVLQTIEARSTGGLEIARRGLEGALSRRIQDLILFLRSMIAEIEASLDHPDAALENPSEQELVAALESRTQEIERSLACSLTGQRQIHGARVVLLGPVNAGKSSLLNALAGSLRAIVDENPGTTRDVVEASIMLDGLPLVLVDTAGERETSDYVENMGLLLRDDQIERADLLLVVIPSHRVEDSSGERVLALTCGRNRLLIGNHADRAGASPSRHGHPLILTSALTGLGLDTLKAEIRRALVDDEPGDVSLLLGSMRQIGLLRAAATSMHAAALALQGEAGIVVAAEALMEALQRLVEIEGRTAREDVLDELFSRFCIGK